MRSTIRVWPEFTICSDLDFLMTLLVQPFGDRFAARGGNLLSAVFQWPEDFWSGLHELLARRQLENLSGGGGEVRHHKVMVTPAIPR